MFSKKIELPLFVVKKNSGIKIIHNKFGVIVTTNDIDAVRFMGTIKVDKKLVK